MRQHAKICAYFIGFLYGPDRFAHMLDHAHEADRLGFDAVQVGGHIVSETDPGPFGADRYRDFATIRQRNLTERAPAPANTPWFEVMTQLAAIGGVTNRVELISSIVAAPLYPTALLAKSAVTIDHLTGGRLRLGLGSGYMKPEFDAVGSDFDDRGRMLDEMIPALRRLWSPGQEDDVLSYSSRSIDIQDVFFAPTARSADSIKIYIGGTTTKRTLRRVATMGDGWLPWRVPFDQLREFIDEITQATTAAGRDADSLTFAYRLPLRRGDGSASLEWEKADLERSMATIPEVLATGVNLLTFPVHLFYDDPVEAPEVMERTMRLWHDIVD